jgi:hypothetical protein
MRPTPCQNETETNVCRAYIHVRYDAAASIRGTAIDAYPFTTMLWGAGELVVAYTI